MIQPLFKETNNNGPTTVYTRQRPYSTSVFLSACFHPLHILYTTTMNAEEENRLLEPVEEEDEDESTTQKPDDVPELCTKKQKEVTRSEFESLQVQVSSVTTAINNFGDILKSFMDSEKKPRYDNELLAAQSAPYSAQSVSSIRSSCCYFCGRPTLFRNSSVWCWSR